MSFTLIDTGSENFELTANVWTWKAALEVIKSFDIIGEGAVRQMSYNATGATISPEDAHLIGERVRDELLPKMSEKGRIFADLSITDQPDDKTIYKDEDEQWKNYSASYDWLKEFSEFCLKSKGFRVF